MGDIRPNRSSITKPVVAASLLDQRREQSLRVVILATLELITRFVSREMAGVALIE